MYFACCLLFVCSLLRVAGSSSVVLCWLLFVVVRCSLCVVGCFCRCSLFFVVRCWLLVVGCWLLVVCLCCLLVVGDGRSLVVVCWLLVVAGRLWVVVCGLSCFFGLLLCVARSWFLAVCC